MKLSSTDSKVKYSYYQSKNNPYIDTMIEDPYHQMLRFKTNRSQKMSRHVDWKSSILLKTTSLIKRQKMWVSFIFLLLLFTAFLFLEDDNGLQQCFDLFAKQRCDLYPNDGKCPLLTACIIKMKIPEFIEASEHWLIQILKNVWVWVAPFVGVCVKIIFKYRQKMGRSMINLQK